MKTLYIVRHAKSSWDYPGLSDDERPLIKKGIKRTNKIADFLQAKNIKVDLFLSSYAVRAHETAKIIAETLGYPADKISTTKHLYHGSTDHIYNELHALPDDIENVMIFGHNPTFTSFANHFLSKKIDWLPTTGVVAISFKTDKWTDITLANQQTEFVIYPRDL